MDKQYYIDWYLKEYENGLIEHIKDGGTESNYYSDEYIYSANAIVGYYILTYSDCALKQWNVNLLLASNNYSTDKDVTSILNELYGGQNNG